MDSGNSGSFQSSSGGDEEFDSRAESMSAFLNSSSSSAHVGVMSSAQQPLQPLQLLRPRHHGQQHPSTSFDPLSTYLDVFTQPTTPNPVLNLDMVWPRGSAPNCTQPGGLTGLTFSSSSSQSNLIARQPPGPNTFPDPSSKALPLENSSKASGSSDQTNVTRNPKKRSRASRRAPTTVLTTDTSNFRAMVQEFTGIPAPPFSASQFPRTRLDLFNNVSMRSSFDQLPTPPYILRPFAHKVQPPSFVSSTISATTNFTINDTNTTPPRPPSTTNIANNISSNISNSNSTNHQLTSELGFPRQTQSLLNIQNPMPNFQSLLQSTLPKYPLLNERITAAKSQYTDPVGSADSSNRKGGMLEDYRTNHSRLGTLSNVVTTDGFSVRSNDSWGAGVRSHDGEPTHLPSFNGTYGKLQMVSSSSSCKMNFSAPSSDFHTEKTPENVSARGEGMVDSWIYSSD